MKKILTKSLVLAVAIFLSVLFIAPAMIHAAPAVESITVTSTDSGIPAIGQSAHYTATATYSDATTADVTADPGTTWAINDPSLATNNGGGLFTGKAQGSTWVSATFGGAVGWASLNVQVPGIYVSPGKPSESTNFDLWAQGCNGLTWSLVVNNGAEDVLSLGGKILDNNWNNNYHYVLPAGAYTATFSVGGNPQEVKAFSIWGFDSSMDVSVGYAGETTTFTLKATNSSGKTAQFQIWDITNSTSIYNQDSIPIGSDDWSYPISQTLAAGHFSANFWVEGTYAGGYDFYVVNRGVSQPQPSAPSKPLTPEQQASLDLSIGQQADLYGKTNIGFTKMLYDNILGRAADGEGLNNWVTALNEGKITLSSVVYNFVFSKELEPIISAATPEEFITFLYKNVLDRNPDPQGLASWGDNIKNGMSKEDVLLHFIDSGEFKDICTMFNLKI
ncbi:MAG: DUF4214 domain-containing protein [Candidatus Humimicrobiaceae bacterium]